MDLLSVFYISDRMNSTCILRESIKCSFLETMRHKREIDYFLLHSEELNVMC
jgi:hypothetical protein